MTEGQMMLYGGYTLVGLSILLGIILIITTVIKKSRREQAEAAELAGLQQENRVFASRLNMQPSPSSKTDVQQSESGTTEIISQGESGTIEIISQDTSNTTEIIEGETEIIE